MGNLKFRLWRIWRQVEHWLTAQLAFAVLALLRLLPAKSAMAFADRFARRFGPPGSDNEVSLTALSLKGRYADFHEDKFRHEPDLYLGVRIGW